MIRGLDIGVSGLLTAQRAAELAGHNLANVHTPEFTRQIALMSSKAEAPTIPRIGSGVQIEDILRVEDTYLVERLRTQDGAYGYADVRSSILAEVNTVLQEPSEYGLNARLARLVASIEELSTAPTDLAVRMQMVVAADELATGIRELDQRLMSIRKGIQDEIDGEVASANGLLAEVNDLNAQIAVSEARGGTASDLRDIREQRVRELLKTIGGSAVNEANGMVSLEIDSEQILKPDGTYVELAAPSSYPAEPGSGLPVAITAVGIGTIDVSGGRIGALVDLHDVELERYLTRLDAFAETLVSEFNTEHEFDPVDMEGYDLDGHRGGDFFEDTGTPNPGYDGRSARIAVCEAVLHDPSLVAAASQDHGLDNENALKLIALFDKEFDISSSDGIGETGLDDKFTLGGFYELMITGMASDARFADQEQEAQATLLRSLENRRDSISGPSIEEETVNLMRAQQAFQASAKVISTIEAMLDTLVNL